MVQLHYEVLWPKTDEHGFSRMDKPEAIGEAASVALTAFQEEHPTREIVSVTVAHCPNSVVPHRLVIAYQE